MVRLAIAVPMYNIGHGVGEENTCGGRSMVAVHKCVSTGALPSYNLCADPCGTGESWKDDMKDTGGKGSIRETRGDVVRDG